MKRENDIKGMSKQGPCFHCGIRDTPLWRHGPPEKPVLCNACGSRYRVRGNLDDYVPNHTKFLMINTHDQQTAPYYNYNTRRRSNLNGNDTTSNVATSSSSSKSTSESAYQGIDTSSWKNSIPSRKRSRLVQHQETELSMKKFHRQLLSFWEIQKAENGESYQEILVYKQNPVIPSNEIGLGCTLLHPADQTNNNDSDHQHH